MTAKNPWLIIGTLSAGLAVAAGAYGWHGLGDNKFFKDAFWVGVQFHMWHSLALLAVAWFTDSRPQTDRGAAQAKWGRIAGLLFVLGMLLFSGTLYVFGVTQSLPAAGLAPAGGMTLMAGWAIFAFAATR
ncbi:MAG: DUF423 domain-containing protein [Alphaproteobacteria bacterium]|nr:DUF423 domain-containing protein [Alphaproteobacteria bacterium]